MAHLTQRLAVDEWFVREQNQVQNRIQRPQVVFMIPPEKNDFSGFFGLTEMLCKNFLIAAVHAKFFEGWASV